MEAGVPGTGSGGSGVVPREERYVLSVDLGTGGPKVGLVSLVGEIAWKDHVAVETRHLPGGGAVQDAAEWWDVVVEAAGRALGAGVVRPEQVVAVCCTGQWASTVPVDSEGVPVGECVMWMDTRGGRHTRAAVGGPVVGYSPTAVAKWVRRTGGAPSTSGADPIGHMLYLERDAPDVARKARWYLEPVDYLSMRFTGSAFASPASMTGAWLTDNRDPLRLEYDPELARTAGVPLDKLAPLRPTGSVVGVVQPKVAAELGLGDSVSVVTGVPDLHSAAFGSGAVRDFDAHIAISTTSWTSCPVPFKRTDPIRQIASVPGIVPGGYVIADNHETAGLCLQWMRDNVVGGGADGRLSGAGGAGSGGGGGAGGAAVGGLSFDELTALAAGVEPGSGDVIFTPWLIGERSPVDDRAARGGFHNVSLSATQSHMIRAVMEGVAYNSRWLHEAVEKFVRRRLDPIRLVGGGAISDLWCQIHADVMDRKIERVAEPMHANLRGAGLMASVALGAVTRGEIRDLVKVDRVFTPDRSAVATYQRLFAEFPKLYKAQKGMFSRLNRS